MNKKAIFTFGGMDQDTTKSKHQNTLYYEANNVRISATNSQSTGSISNEKGNKFKFSIPTPIINTNLTRIEYGDEHIPYVRSNNNGVYPGCELEDMYDVNGTPKQSGTQVIIGHTIAREAIILFTTDDNGFDCIWSVDKDYKLKLLYMRDLGFSKYNLIQAVFNFENTRIQKVYWVDGNSQLRTINIEHSISNENEEDLIDVSFNTINVVGNFEISQPTIQDIISGGTHTAGRIQYAYNLYRVNGSQTKLSPLSEMVSLSKGGNLGGGDVNEIVGRTPIVKISNIDTEYTHIKVYAIKYTSYNQIPTVSIISDRTISNNGVITVFDDGNVINDISLAEFLFLGSDPIIPNHIEVKDNTLFSANIKERNFDANIDTRAYSFTSGSNPACKVHDKPTLNNLINQTGGLIVNNNYSIPEKHDSINLNYDIFKCQRDGATLGGEGKYLKYEIVKHSTPNSDNKQFFKDNEVYRLGIEFYNVLGQRSFPKWIADFRAPDGNLEGNFNTLKVTFKPEFYVWLNTSTNFASELDKPVGYKILRANRTLNDRTIITQGFLNGMMSNFRGSGKQTTEFTQEGSDRQWKGNKLPSLQRVFGNHHTQMKGMKDMLKLDTFTGNDNQREVHKAKSSDNHIAETFQFNRLIQLFSPEVMFENVATYEGLSLKIRGGLKSKVDNFWGQARKPSTKDIKIEGKVLGAITPHDDGIETSSIGNLNKLANHGIFGPPGVEDTDEMDFYQFYRDFTDSFIVNNNNRKYPIYGKPELTEKGQDAVYYNNDADFEYYNTLQPMIADGGDDRNETGPAITSVNSWGAKCLTMVLGNDGISKTARPTLEKLFNDTTLGTNTNVMLVADIVKNDEQIYLGNIYGGNSYENKKRTSYIQIGNYNPIDVSGLHITSPGDTCVHKFRFTKICKTDTETYSNTTMQVTEIVEGIVESTVDLRNRNDMSFNGWDSRFQPRYDEYHKYNRVYSQQPTLFANQDSEYTFKKVNDFDTRIIASKVKVPGEVIDSWTDTLVNETMDLNGKYGPINSLVTFKDQLYALQDNALIAIAVNPRVQVQGSDGIAVELGSGKVLHDYKYLSTNSGTLNKWGIITSEYGLYYLDLRNKAFMRFSGQLENLSDKMGMHSWFNNNVIELLSVDNPVIGSGVSMGYDISNNDVILTLKNQNAIGGENTTNTSSKTIIFHEPANRFTSLMSYIPSRYITIGDRLYSLSNTNNSVYKHFEGDYNNFYGTYYPSYITLQVNPDVNHHCVFNNVEFNSELYVNGLDQPNTLTHIQAYNEYQDSGLTPLVIGRSNNLRRKFRTWRADVPRDGRNRIRNPWTYIKLELNNTDNAKLILHDIIVSYTVS